MTKFDVKQYLEKIYNVPVVGVRVKMLYHDRKLFGHLSPFIGDNILCILGSFS